MRDKFDVVLTNRFVPGKTEAEVKSALCALFKMPEEKIERLLKAGQFIIKRNVDHATAMKYQGRLRQAGVLALIKPVDIPLPQRPQVSRATQTETRSEAPSESVQRSEAASTTEPGLTTALNVGDALPPKPEPPTIQTPDFEVDPPGTELLKGVSKPAPPPPPNTDHLSLAPVGERIGPERPKQERNIDLSHLQLAPVGERLTSPRPQPHVEIDTSGLQIEEP